MDRYKLKDGIRLSIARVLDFKTDQRELECLADHLIAKGIGDIAAEKHRADVAEKALNKIKKFMEKDLVYHTCNVCNCDIKDRSVSPHEYGATWTLYDEDAIRQINNILEQA